MGQKAAIAAGIAPATGLKVNIALNAQQKPTVSARPAGSSASPHGTRPATLYYTSQPKKEASNSMKPTNNASPSAAAPTSSASSASTARPAQAANTSASAARPVASTGPTNAAASTARPVNTPGAANVTSSATRPTTVNSTPASRPASANFDYRANVERQSREQKSVGNILAYVVYGIGFFFLISVVLASYGAYTINRQLHDQATSISSLDDKYAGKVADLGKQLATTQDNLNVAQAQINRAQDLINKQEDEINQLHAALAAASSANSDAVHAEVRARAQEAASLRARIRDLEYRMSMQQSTTRVP